MFDHTVTDAVKAAAVAAFPHEMCGVVYLDGDTPAFKQTKNIHPEPERSFRISGRVLAPLRRDGKLLAIVHSHPRGNYWPSRNDMVSQIETGTTFGLTVCDGENASPVLWWGDDVPKPPLVGREFIPGILDCYGIIRDYYKEKLGIYLRDYPRDDAWWEEEGATSLYLDFVEAEGFVRITDEPRLHDLQMMKIRSELVNHCAVIVGQDQILHHFGDRLSHDEDSASKWMKQTHSFWRHKSLL